MENPKKNLSESIYNRLKNVAKTRERPVQEVLKYYAMERFLYRLGISPYQKSFYLKGGLMLMLWNPKSHRATVDIDLLSKTSNSISNLQKIIKEICSSEFNLDGVFNNRWCKYFYYEHKHFFLNRIDRVGCLYSFLK